MPPFFFWLEMPQSEDVPTAADIEDSVAEDVASGVAKFTTGDTSVEAMDPLKRLKVARELNRDTLPTAGKSPVSTLGNTVRLINGQGAWG